MRRLPAPALMALGVLACQDGPRSDLVGEEFSRTKPHGTYVVVTPDSGDGEARFGPGPAHRLVFMNRNGGTYTRASIDDSSQNRSSVPSGTATVSAWSYGDTEWDRLMTCVRNIYAPFDVTITDVDPGTMPHIESVVGGFPNEVGLPNYVGGVSPFRSDCAVIERSIVYTFAGLYSGDFKAICETVAQETAHSFGLDHELDCSDPMTYLNDCGPKTFQDKDVNCGEDSPRPCACGGSTQNSAAILRMVLGDATSDLTPPNLTIVRPANGATVAPLFEIEGDATDDTGVESVTLFIDGSEWATDTNPPYVFTAPDGLANGSHTIELRASDLRGNVTPQSVTVNLDDGTGGTGDPGTEPPPGGTGGDRGMGAPCAVAGDCDSGFCSGVGTCSEGCDPLDQSACGAGFECAAYESGGGECLPVPSNGLIGGCVVGGRTSSAPAAILLFALVLVLRRRR